MIPYTPHYNKNIDWSKLTEQKNPFEYIVPLPQEGPEKKAFHGQSFLDVKNLNDLTSFFHHYKNRLVPRSIV